MKKEASRLCLTLIASLILSFRLDEVHNHQITSIAVDGLLTATLSSPQVHGPLNVIVFYPDDWRHDDLGDTNAILKTPFFPV